MNLLTQIFKSIPLTAVGIYLVYEVTKEPNGDFIFDWLWVLGKFIIGFILLLWTFNNNRKEFAETKYKLSFLPVISATGCALLFYLAQPKENPSVLFAGYDGGFNGAFIDLRADGTYKVSNGNGLGSDNFYGNYQIEDSLIILDKSSIDRIIESNKLVVRPNLTAFLPENDTLLYQLDENGIAKTEATVFTVHIDRRRN